MTNSSRPKASGSDRGAERGGRTGPQQLDPARIAAALAGVAVWLRPRPAAVGRVEFTQGDDPVTETDRTIDEMIARAGDRRSPGP